jgi:hypothetical protein
MRGYFCIIFISFFLLRTKLREIFGISILKVAEIMRYNGLCILSFVIRQMEFGTKLSQDNGQNAKQRPASRYRAAGKFSALGPPSLF